MNERKIGTTTIFLPSLRKDTGSCHYFSFLKRALSMVLEWYEKHSAELLEDWELARNREPLKKIAPLE